MGSGYSVFGLILAALVAANLPFITERRFVLWAPPVGSRKSLLVQVVELLVLYVLTGLLGLALEQHAGQIYPQRWEFYAITAALFLTLAFPGFVYRYLLHRH